MFLPLKKNPFYISRVVFLLGILRKRDFLNHCRSLLKPKTFLLFLSQYMKHWIMSYKSSGRNPWTVVWRQLSRLYACTSAGVQTLGGLVGSQNIHFRRNLACTELSLPSASLHSELMGCERRKGKVDQRSTTETANLQEACWYIPLTALLPITKVIYYAFFQQSIDRKVLSARALSLWGLVLSSSQLVRSSEKPPRPK